MAEDELKWAIKGNNSQNQKINNQNAAFVHNTQQRVIAIVLHEYFQIP